MVYADGRKLTQPLIIAEEKKLILDDGETDRGAELIAAKLGLGWVEGRPRIHVGVAKEPEGVAMNLIGAGLDHRIDYAAAGAAKLRRSDARLHGKFRDCIGWRRS